MIDKYIINGDVKCSLIAMDIKRRILKREDIEILVNNTQINSAFFGNTYNDKKPKQFWDKSYLDLLSYASVAESFNRDYLLYLDEVAEYVNKSASKYSFVKKGLFGLIVIAVVIIIVIIIGGK